jgi:hypothetical protein
MTPLQLKLLASRLERPATRVADGLVIPSAVVALLVTRKQRSEKEYAT